MKSDQDRKAAIERLTKRIVFHGRKTGKSISEEEARKKAIKAQNRHRINNGE